MGDVISALPALTDAKANLKNVVFDWVVEENFSEIPSWHSAVNRTIPIALRRWRQNLFDAKTLQEIVVFLRNLRVEDYDYIIDAQGLIKSAIVARFAHGQSCGFGIKSAREKIAACFYRNRFDITKDMHTVDRIRQLFAAALGYEQLVGVPNYGIVREKFISENKEDEKYLVFVHGTSRAEKCWAEEKWLSLAHIAKEAGFKIKVPWGNKREFILAKTLADFNPNVEILPRLNLKELGVILLKAKGAVSVDTGLSHLAAALEVPTVTLYGPTDPQLVGTYGKNQVHLTNFTMLDAEEVWRQVLSIR